MLLVSKGILDIKVHFNFFRIVAPEHIVLQLVQVLRPNQVVLLDIYSLLRIPIDVVSPVECQFGNEIE